MNKVTLTAQAIWDDETNVWVATSDDIPGLVTEAPTIEALIERIRLITPDLLTENAHLLPQDDRLAGPIDLCVQSQHRISLSR